MEKSSRQYGKVGNLQLFSRRKKNRREAAIWKFPIDHLEISNYLSFMEDELKTHLRAVFEAFSTASPLSPTTIWDRAAKDGRFLGRIESGKTFTAKTYDRAIVWFFDNWPANAVWPASVPVPAGRKVDAA